MPLCITWIVGDWGRQDEDLPRNVTFSVLSNPPQRNKQEALQCSYGILRWQAVVKEVNTGEAMVPVVDFWRVFVDGKYWGKTRSLSFCLRKSGREEGNGDDE